LLVWLVWSEESLLIFTYFFNFFFVLICVVICIFNNH
jgi:hypothetical protein